jgi:hypothetical protein
MSKFAAEQEFGERLAFTCHAESTKKENEQWSNGEMEK